MPEHVKAPSGGNRSGAFENYVLGSAQSEDIAKVVRPQALHLLSAMQLAARRHALAGLQARGAESHVELSLATFYGSRATTLALLGEAAR